MIPENLTFQNISIADFKIHRDYCKKITSKSSSNRRIKICHVHRKEKNNKIFSNLRTRKNLLDFSIIILSIILYTFMLSEIYCFENYILLTAQGGGDKLIISDQFSSYLPSKAQINDGTIINSPTKVQSLPPGLNTIKLIWDSQIATTENMFRYLTHIISIDCTHFDFSEVTVMYSFFEGCTSLLSIAL